LAEQARVNAYVVSIQEEINQITATDAKLKSSKNRRTITELERLLKDSERAKIALKSQYNHLQGSFNIRG